MGSERIELGLEGSNQGLGPRWSEELGGWCQSGWNWVRKSLGRGVGFGSGGLERLGLGGLGLGKLGSGDLRSGGTWGRESRDQGD